MTGFRARPATLRTNDFLISDMGVTSSVAFAAFDPDVSYNPTENEYLVVWVGDDLVNDEFEIFGQRINASTGAEVGTNDFRLMPASTATKAAPGTN